MKRVRGTGASAMASRRGRLSGERTGTGVRGVMRATAADLASRAPQEMREQLAPHVGLFCDQLRAALSNPEGTAFRTALTLYAQIMQAVGSGDVLVQSLVLQLGAPIADARAAVEAVGSAPRDPHEIAAQARAFLAWFDGPNGPGGQAE